ncbi:MAG TPA: hypothetical protein VIM98_14855, partial [Dyella sp.]|uniref:hypothetical protein n=1 Tax=Dyella sp. TaxID=1869338 RepID=UPI002F95095B
MQTSFKRAALAAAVVFSFQAQAQFVADGVHKDASAGGTYETFDDLEDTFRAINGGSISADNVTIASFGDVANGVHAGGKDSSVMLTRGSVTTSGESASALYADGNASIAALGTNIKATGALANGAETATGGIIVLTSGSIDVSGGGSWGISNDDGSVTANNVNIVSSSTPKLDGFFFPGGGVASVQGTVTLNGGSVLTTGDAVFGLLAKRGRIFTDGTYIATTGNNSPAANAFEGILTLKGGSVSTSGESSLGLSVMIPDEEPDIFKNGGAVSASGTRVETLGRRAHGVYLSSTDYQSTATTAYLDSGSSITTRGANAAGIFAQATRPHYAKIIGNDIVVRADDGEGLYLNRFADMDLKRSSVSSGTQVALYLDALDAQSTLSVTDSTLVGDAGYGLYVRGGTPLLSLDNALVQGKEGAFGAEGDPGTHVNVEADRGSRLLGDVVAFGDATLHLDLLNGSSLQGAALPLTNGHIDLSVDATSRWTITSESAVRTLDNRGQIAFTGDYSRLRVLGNYQGGGAATLRTVLNVGGALGNQYTDRLLVAGDASGVTALTIDVRGNGANTNVANDHQMHGYEGISLVQVAGNANAGSFALAHGYVTA